MFFVLVFGNVVKGIGVIEFWVVLGAVLFWEDLDVEKGLVL